MSRVKQLVAGPTELDQVWGRREAYYDLFMDDYNKSIGRVDPVLVELCRLRVAQMVESEFDIALRYRPAIDAGLTEAKISALTDYPTSELFTSRERAALEFTEQWVIASATISDDDVAALQTHVTPEEFMYLCKALSVVDQLARANSAFRLARPEQAPPTMPQFAVRDYVAA